MLGGLRSLAHCELGTSNPIEMLHSLYWDDEVCGYKELFRNISVLMKKKTIKNVANNDNKKKYLPFEIEFQNFKSLIDRAST